MYAVRTAFCAGLASAYAGAVVAVLGSPGHPIYSFAVIGALSERFHGVDNFSGNGAGSPFGILCELDGKIAVLDLDDQNSMTFYHHIEQSRPSGGSRLEGGRQ
ncbi:MAG: hypothetical protein D9V47_03140 [Clostridia bacterium]|nr:MAG: hypothetical protein D9V47_03140 [Clostridia bacterium]